MSASTPGPWATSQQHPTIIKLAPDFLGESSVLICSAHGHLNNGFFPSEEEAVANARLIAAAPELLKLLQGADVLFACHCTDSTALGWLHDTRAAIAKATGEKE